MTNRHAFSLILGLIAVCPVSAALGAAGDTETATTLLTYCEAEWYGSTFWTGPDWTRVGKDWHHPGQDAFKTQLDRQPKDAVGNALPSLEVKGGKRTYRVPTKATP